MNHDPSREYRSRVRLLVVTISDRVAAEVYADESGPQAAALAGEFLEGRGFRVTVVRRSIPDSQPGIERVLSEAIAGGIDLVLTTGGTGIGERDVTPEATRAVITKELPGFMEAIRVRYCNRVPTVLLSRAVAGLAESTLIFNLPGSVQAVQECLGVILPAVPHALEIVRGRNGHDHVAD
jgi:molybdopterin adenylyltransferase